MAGEWFFSTLAQVSAAVVGFILAITMVRYSLEKERKLNRTSKFRDLLEDLYQTYNSPFDRIQAQFSSNAPDDMDYDHYIFQEYGAENIRDDLFTENFQKHPIPVQFYVLNIHITTTVFHDLKPGMPTIPDRESIVDAGEGAMELKKLLGRQDKSKQVYQALTDSSEVPEDFMSEQVFNPPIKWDGGEIQSLKDVEELSSDMVREYFKITDYFPSVYLDYTMGFYNIINISIYVIIFGVLFPLLAMFTPPSIFPFRISNNMVFFSQLIMLFSSSLLTFSLIELVMDIIRTDIAQSEELESSWITQQITDYIPTVV